MELWFKARKKDSIFAIIIISKAMRKEKSPRICCNLEGLKTGMNHERKMLFSSAKSRMDTEKWD